MEAQQPGMPSPDALGALLSNPDLIRRVGAILGGMSAPAETASAEPLPPEAPSDVPTASVSPPLGNTDGLLSILSDPSMMEKLPAVMAAIKPMMGAIPTPKESGGGSPSECRDRLLLALKPFLSSERRSAVDGILRIAKLSAVFRELT